MPERTRTLGQVVAVERSLRQADNDYGSQILHHTLKESNVTGEMVKFEPFTVTEDNDPISQALKNRRPQASYKEVQRRVDDALEEVRKYAAPAVDVVATKDSTNTNAVADVIVDGEVFLPKVPVSHLLWLETYFNELFKQFVTLPTLRPDKKWTLNEQTGLWESRPEKKISTSKEVIPLVLYPATDKHAAQTDKITKDVPVGETTTTTLSGAVTEKRKRQYMDNLKVLQNAVKDAIAVANRTQATEVQEGNKIFDFLFRS